MRDTIPAGTGNSRFLKSAIAADATWEDAKAALRAGSFPVDFGGVNADGVTQLGTPYSKAAVLTDETAAALGLDPTENPTPNDAFLKGGANKVRVEFLTSGTWTAPANIVDNKIHAWCCGGGGGGGNGGVPGSNVHSGGGGGAGGYVTEGDFEVSPGDNYTIVIGAGGNAGSAGGITSFGSLLSAAGGGGGSAGNGAYVNTKYRSYGGNGGTGGSGGGGGYGPDTQGSGGTGNGGGNGGGAKSDYCASEAFGDPAYSGTDHASQGGNVYIQNTGGGGGGNYGGSGGSGGLYISSSGGGGGGGGGFFGDGGAGGMGGGGCSGVRGSGGGGGPSGELYFGGRGGSGVVRIEYYIKGASA